MTKEEATNYKARFLSMVRENGIDWLIGQVDPERMRKLAICEDYKRLSGTQVSMKHGSEERTITKQSVSRLCGGKAACSAST